MMFGELAALGAALSWTVSAVMYKEALEKTKPISANIVRLASTSAILIAFTFAVGKFWVLMDLPLEAIVMACISGIIGLGFGDTLYMKSLKLVGVARAVPITCTYPLFNLLWATFFENESITLTIVLGAFAIVFGIWLLSQKGKEGVKVSEKRTLIIGVASALLTAIFWSISIAMINMAVRENPELEHALAINIIRTTAIAASLLILAPIIDREHGFIKMQKKTFAALIFGGLVALGLGWFFLTYSFTQTTESQAVPISSTTPLFSTLSAIIFLHEKVTILDVAGSIIIVTGIFLIFTA
ncbi:MAG: DMT family transporter [Candidatus Bathyarchaeia archaeon]